MDRREFLKKSAITVASVAAVGVLGKTVFNLMDKEETIEQTNNTMKKILVLNGSPRKNGKTASLVNAFRQGAEGSGHEVREFYLNGMDIKGCIACESCSQNGGHCVQQDAMTQVYDAYEWADVVVLASPEFWGTVSGQLKIVVDRLYAEINKLGMAGFRRDMVLIMTARGNDYSQALDFYHIFTEIIGCRNLGTVLGPFKEDEARQLGASIK
jgi:multimeric flavodoxin WrbA